MLQQVTLDTLRAGPTTPNNHDYLDHDLNRNSESTFLACVDTTNTIIIGI